MLLFIKKNKIAISCESSAEQMIYMTYQALFFVRKKKKKRCFIMSAAFMIGSLWVMTPLVCLEHSSNISKVLF